ncbi:MAG: helix-turn-helix domain-containing protein [Bacilli bacterium]|nr:helix-turn-helix domain-containing protein [Bacilli bacterium]
MKEIGEKLRLAREDIGISIEEAAEDLKMRPSQIENIENGDIEQFKDIFYLKYFIRDYSKYLGINYEEMVDEFNEYLFDYTSKISLDEIKKAKKEIKEKNSDKISSPYTIEYKEKVSAKKVLMYIFITIIVLIIIYFLFKFIINVF